MLAEAFITGELVSEEEAKEPLLLYSQVGRGCLVTATGPRCLLQDKGVYYRTKASGGMLLSWLSLCGRGQDGPSNYLT